MNCMSMSTVLTCEEVQGGGTLRLSFYLFSVMFISMKPLIFGSSVLTSKDVQDEGWRVARWPTHPTSAQCTRLKRSPSQENLSRLTICPLALYDPASLVYFILIPGDHTFFALFLWELFPPSWETSEYMQGNLKTSVLPGLKWTLGVKRTRAT